MTGPVGFADADHEHDEYGDRGTGQECGYRDDEHQEGHQASLPSSSCREFPVNPITSFPVPGNLVK
jgi:hypothetical protein